jgi:hypothetical protein
LLKLGAINEVKNGKTLFWQDVWLGDTTLQIQFKNLYDIFSDPNCTVADCFSEGEWQVSFRGSFSDKDQQDWLSLSNILNNFNLEGRNRMILFGHCFLTDGGVKSRIAKVIWGCQNSNENQVLSMANYQRQIASSAGLKAARLPGWKENVNCILRGKPETINHIFFKCYLATLGWCIFRVMFNWEDIPKSTKDFWESWMHDRFLSRNVHVRFCRLSMGVMEC